MKDTIIVRCGEEGHGQLVGEIWLAGEGVQVTRRDGRLYWYSGRNGEPAQEWGWTLPELPTDFWHTDAPYKFACPRHEELTLTAAEARDAVSEQRAEVLAHSASL